MLGDLNIAEPEALISFAGPRVIEQTIRQKIPKGFQRSEFLLEKGFLDRVVDRRKMRDELNKIITLLNPHQDKNETPRFEKPLKELKDKIEQLKAVSEQGKMEMGAEIQTIEKRAEKVKKQIYDKLTTGQILQISRHPDRPDSLSFVSI